MMQPSTAPTDLANIATMTNLQAAWRAVRRKRGEAGLDGITLQEFQNPLPEGEGTGHRHSVRNTANFTWRRWALCQSHGASSHPLFAEAIPAWQHCISPSRASL